VSIVNLRNYDLVITTSYNFKFGVCGHLFEMIEYYWAIKNWTKLNVCILLSDGTTLEEFNTALNSKYEDLIVNDVFYHPFPRLLLTKNLLIVDGSSKFKNTDVYTDNFFLLRCHENEYEFYSNNKAQCHLFQDFEIYDDIPLKINVIDYKKKLLYSKFKEIKGSVEEDAMFYLTDVSRFVSEDELKNIIKKYNFKNSVVFTNKPDLYKFIKTYEVPVVDMWNKFSKYVYTKLPGKKDCSSRFILECMYYNKEVIYDIDYYDKFLEVRKKDGIIKTSLERGDLLVEYLNERIKC
jgi:hypothetical protein